jgi:hypothetical protein
MRSFLLLIAVISELSSAFVPQLKFFGSCWIPNIRNERRCFRDLTLSLAPSKSVENDMALASVFERNVASCNESSTAIVITGANGVLGQSLIWYRNLSHLIMFTANNGLNNSYLDSLTFSGV